MTDSLNELTRLRKGQELAELHFFNLSKENGEIRSKLDKIADTVHAIQLSQVEDRVKIRALYGNGQPGVVQLLSGRVDGLVRKVYSIVGGATVVNAFLTFWAKYGIK